MSSSEHRGPDGPAVEGSGLNGLSGHDRAGRVEALRQSREFSRRVTRDHAKSFYFASSALPRHRREAAYAVYAFCRHADDAVDEAEGDEDAQRDALASLDSGLDGIFSVDGPTTGWPFGEALAAAIRDFGLPRRAFDELLAGVLMDVRPRVRLETWAELERYCYHVASTVGLIMCPLLGLRDPAGEARAIDLGIAMQLTNILRDVGEDLERDRIYLPSEELGRFGLDEAMLRRGEVTGEWREFMRFQIDRARSFYDSSEEGIGLLAADGSQLTVWLMHQVYGDILHQIERLDYQVFERRAATSRLRKLRLAWRAWRRARA